VLLRDLPSLYGIQNIQELNRLFQVLAFNTGQEVSLEGLSQNSGVAKNTIQRYLTYLETAFLIHRLRRVDDTARRFVRQRGFKVYLTNTSMRAALFSPLEGSHPGFGALAETAVFCQWLHSPTLRHLYYARWAGGEVDAVMLKPPATRPRWAYDVKWSDHHVSRLEELRPMLDFAVRNRLRTVGVTTRTKAGIFPTDLLGTELRIFPLALHCYALGLLSARDPEALGSFLQ